MELINYKRNAMVYREPFDFISPPNRKITPISALNPHHRRWIIKARVTLKGECCPYFNANGDGEYFIFEVVDSRGSQIQVKCFNSAVEQFYDKIHVGNVYLIANGKVSHPPKRYNPLKNEWEIILEDYSTVRLYAEDDNPIPKQCFRFRQIYEIKNLDKGSLVDIIGIVCRVNPTRNIRKKDGTQALRRILMLKDSSSCSIEFTLWGEFCNNEGQRLQELLDDCCDPVVAVKAARVSDYGGRSVVTGFRTEIFIDTDIVEAQELKSWYEGGGKDISSQPLTNDVSAMINYELRKTIAQIEDEGFGKSDQLNYIWVKATIYYMDVNKFCYKACPIVLNPDADYQCRKKVTERKGGNYYCERCNKTSKDYEYKYRLEIQIRDHTGSIKIIAFEEARQELLGIKGKDLYTLRYIEQDDLKFMKIFQDVIYKQYLFKLRVKEGTYNDGQGVECLVVTASRIEYSSESKALLDLITKFPTAELIRPSSCQSSSVSSSSPSQSSSVCLNSP